MLTASLVGLGEINAFVHFMIRNIDAIFTKINDATYDNYMMCYFLLIFVSVSPSMSI